VFVAEAPIRLDLFLARATGKSRAFVQEQIALGSVRVNGSPAAKASQPLKAGDAVTVSWTEMAPKPLRAVPYSLEILHEDRDMLVINKPQGVVTHPGAGTRGPTLVNYLMHHLQHDSAFARDFKETDRPGIVHRLDRGTSGVICVAKHRSALEKISAQFKERQVSKIYEAIVWGKLTGQGVFRSPIGRDPQNRKKMSSKSPTGREAQTEWAVAAAFAQFTHVRLFPKTGRTHQLRVHLSEGRHPIVGDKTYGGKRATEKLPLPEALKVFLEPIGDTFLHAAELRLAQPSTGEAMTFRARRPPAFDEFLALLQTP
jgi:23S rRNA pseudouridine1911/1915/1917 synthase